MRESSEASLTTRRPQRQCRVRERAGWVPTDELQMLLKEHEPQPLPQEISESDRIADEV